MKRWGCGVLHTAAGWSQLQYLGTLIDSVASLEMRNCPCGSTLCLVLPPPNPCGFAPCNRWGFVDCFEAYASFIGDSCRDPDGEARASFEEADRSFDAGEWSDKWRPRTETCEASKGVCR